MKIRNEEVFFDPWNASKVKKHTWWLTNYTPTGIVYCYAYIGKNMLMHHFLFGKPSSGLVYDHIDRNGLNNRESNLRLVTHSINHHNEAMRSNNVSGVRGVSWDEYGQSWRASIRINGRTIHAPRTYAFEKAVEARLKLERKYL
jgi:HNH endonuclease